MKIATLSIKNYRTLESVDLAFPSSYAAICGPNDSGKTNVVRAIRALMKEEASPFGLSDQQELSLKDDYPKWSDTEATKREIRLDLSLILDRHRDAGFYQFIVKQLSIEAPPTPLEICLIVTQRAERAEPVVVVKIGTTEYSDLNAQEVLKKLQSSKSILFHNSTQIEPNMLFRGDRAAGYIREISGQHESLVESMKKTVNRGLAKISKVQQTEFENLLGRLQNRYKVGLSLPAFDFGYLPFRITLGEKKYEVPLDDWGERHQEPYADLVDSVPSSADR